MDHAAKRLADSYAMNDKPISKGDLVIIVRPMPCCGQIELLGTPHTVSGFVDGVFCTGCGTVMDIPSAFLDGESFARPLSTLKRIDPPALSEDVQTKEVIEA